LPMSFGNFNLRRNQIRKKGEYLSEQVLNIHTPVSTTLTLMFLPYLTSVAKENYSYVEDRLGG